MAKNQVNKDLGQFKQNQKFRVPPHDSEAEKSVLGAVLIDDEMLLRVAEVLKPDDFYHPQYATIYESMLELFEKQSPIDVVTLVGQLKKKKKLKVVGGEGTISEIVADTPTAAHCEQYAKLIKETSVRRRMISFGAKMNEVAYNEDQELDLLLDEAEQDLYDISDTAVERDFTHISVLLEKSYQQVEKMSNNPDALRGISTGFRDVDKILGGLQDSDLVILAARPSVGKTAFVLDVARYVALTKQEVEKKSQDKQKKDQEGLKVGFFSLEMSNSQLMDRILSQEIGVGLWELRMGKLKDKDFARLAEAMGKLSESGLYFDDTPGLSIMEMRTKARKLKTDKGVNLIIVDYLQLMEGRSKENRTQEVSEISRFLKQLAREIDVPVIAVSQLSRAVENRSDKIPQLSDLRESGSIEQDADIVMFLHREETFDPDTDRKGIGDLIIAKHRNGPTGIVELAWVKDQARFRDLDKVH